MLPRWGFFGVWDSLEKNLLLPYWGYLCEEFSTSLLGVMLDMPMPKLLRKSLVLPFMGMKFDGFDPF